VLKAKTNMRRPSVTYRFPFFLFFFFAFHESLVSYFKFVLQGSDLKLWLCPYFSDISINYNQMKLLSLLKFSLFVDMMVKRTSLMADIKYDFISMMLYLWKSEKYFIRNCISPILERRNCISLNSLNSILWFSILLAAWI
jgi:hypothetical protein